MRTISLLFVMSYLISCSEENELRPIRGPLSEEHMYRRRVLTPLVSNTHAKRASFPLEATHFATGIDHYFPFAAFNPVDIDLKVAFPAPPLTIEQPPPPPITFHQASITPIQPGAGNSIEKPVEEPQEIVPPQNAGLAVIPRLPPPGIPVNAAAANVPTNTGAVFLGSGSLGVVNLGNGAYALGSGSLGYSNMRSQTRPSTNVPVYPKLPATPNLIPAAVPSPETPPPIIQNFDHPFFDTRQGNTISTDPNQYEPLTPDRVTFGSPSLVPRRPKITQQFATPSAQPQGNPYQFLSPPPPAAPTAFDFGGVAPSFNQAPVLQQPLPTITHQLG